MRTNVPGSGPARVVAVMLLCSVLYAGLSGIAGGAQQLKDGATSRAGSSLPGAASERRLRQHKRLREGTKLQNAIGQFEVTGDRITFYPAGGLEPLRVLENLALERVARELSGIGAHRQWRVDGVITEYRGGNYLLLTRAILTSHSSH